MRVSVKIICLAVLLLCIVMIALRGGFPGPGGAQQESDSEQLGGAVISPPVKQARISENASPAGATDTAALVQQINNALHSSNPADQAMIFTNQFLELIKID